MPPIQDEDLTPDELEYRASAGKSAEPPAEAPAPSPAAAAAEDDDTAGAAAGAGAAAEAPAPALAEGAKKEGEGELDADALASVAGDDGAPDPVAYEVPATDFKAERQKIKDAEADIDKRWVDGALTDEERLAKLAEQRDLRDDLVRQETRAETITELNRQNAQRGQVATLRSIAEASQKAGEVDYSVEKNALAFNQMLGAVMADGDNAGKSFADLAQLAHEALCATRGVKRQAAAAPAPAAAPAAAAPTPAPKPQIPQTLHGMPVAGAVPVGNDFLSTLNAADDPDAAEAALAALPKAQRDALIRATVPSQRRH